MFHAVLLLVAKASTGNEDEPRWMWNHVDDEEEERVATTNKERVRSMRQCFVELRGEIKDKLDALEENAVNISLASCIYFI